MVDIQSVTAEIRRGKKKDRKKKPQDENIRSASATQGGNNKASCNELSRCHLNAIYQTIILPDFTIQDIYQRSNNNHFTAIIQVDLCQLTFPVKNWRILSQQSFTALANCNWHIHIRQNMLQFSSMTLAK